MYDSLNIIQASYPYQKMILCKSNPEKTKCFVEF